MNIRKEDIDLLANSLKEHGLSSIEYADHDFSLKLGNNGEVVEAPFFSNTKRFDVQTKEENNEELVAENSEKESVNNVNTIEIKSPIVGNFYASKKPGDAPFVKVGDFVTSGQTIAIIEAMKVMNEVKAEVSGKVVAINCEDGDFVDALTVIMTVNPDIKE